MVIYYSTVMRSGLPDGFITTAPFEVEGREVGYPTVYEGYMAWYIVDVCVNYNHFNIYG